MNRRSRLLMAVLVALAFAVPATPVSADSPASRAAKLCAPDGFKSLQRSDGSGFNNPGECVAYGAQGGALRRVLDASSQFAFIGGIFDCCPEPDAAGDTSGIWGVAGSISGAFNTPGSGEVEGVQFDYTIYFTWHTLSGVVEGSGPGECLGCVIAGRNGDVALMLTARGTASSHDDFALTDGTWQVTSANGQLAGLNGSGTWTVGTIQNPILFSGTLTLPA